MFVNCFLVSNPLISLNYFAKINALKQRVTAKNLAKTEILTCKTRFSQEFSTNFGSILPALRYTRWPTPTESYNPQASP